MYYRLTNGEYKKVGKVSEITSTDYDLMGEFIPVESLVSIMEDLLHELDILQEKYDDLEKDRDENYELKNFNPYDEYGVSERDFL